MVIPFSRRAADSLRARANESSTTLPIHLGFVGNTVHADLTPAKYQQMLKDGIHVHQEIDVPAKGDYVLRIGVNDFASDHVGAVEILLTVIQPESRPTTP